MVATAENWRRRKPGASPGASATTTGCAISAIARALEGRGSTPAERRATGRGPARILEPARGRADAGKMGGIRPVRGPRAARRDGFHRVGSDAVVARQSGAGISKRVAAPARVVAHSGGRPDGTDRRR